MAPSLATRRHHGPDRAQVSFWDLGSYECEKRYTLPVSHADLPPPPA